MGQGWFGLVPSSIVLIGAVPCCITVTVPTSHFAGLFLRFCHFLSLSCFPPSRPIGVVDITPLPPSPYGLSCILRVCPSLHGPSPLFRGVHHSCLTHLFLWSVLHFADLLIPSWPVAPVSGETFAPFWLLSLVIHPTFCRVADHSEVRPLVACLCCAKGLPPPHSDSLFGGASHVLPRGSFLLLSLFVLWSVLCTGEWFLLSCAYVSCRFLCVCVRSNSSTSTEEGHVVWVYGLGSVAFCCLFG